MPHGYSRGPKKTKIVWTEHDQRLAMVEHGLFIQCVRTYPNLRIHDGVNIRTLDTRYGFTAPAHIARLAFRGDPFFQHLEAFIIQQKKHGWTSAWENDCGHSFKSFRDRLRRAGAAYRAEPRDRPRSSRNLMPATR